MIERWILDAHNNPVVTEDEEEWMAFNFYEPDGPRRVGWTEIGWGRIVSTVFLGINHNFGSGPPLLFETAVFTPKTDLNDGTWDILQRYSTWPDAVEGHERAVRASGGESND